MAKSSFFIIALATIAVGFFFYVSTTNAAAFTRLSNIRSSVREARPNDAERRKRAAVIANPDYHWWTDDVRTIKYILDDTLSPSMKAVAQAGLNFWQENVCIAFEQVQGAPSEDDSWLNIFSDGVDSGCFSSSVGRSFQSNDVLFYDGCANFGVLTHLLGHALGLVHDVFRFDRDTYVTINTDNLNDPFLTNKIDAAETNTYGVPFEYGSIMNVLVEPEFAPIDPSVPVVVANDPLYQQTLGQSVQPSFLDVYIMNVHYGCTARCANGTSAQCQNGGYPDPKSCCQCKCPSGFGGRVCNRVQTSTNGSCGGVLTATSEWQTLNAAIGTDDLSDAPTTCFWHIKSCGDSLIETKVTVRAGDCSPACFFSAVEIKNFKDFRPTGYRHCCAADGNNTHTSEGPLVPVIAYANKAMEFDVKYRFIINPSTQSPACTPCTPGGFFASWSDQEKTTCSNFCSSCIASSSQTCQTSPPNCTCKRTAQIEDIRRQLREQRVSERQHYLPPPPKNTTLSCY